jgi:hypothetical protein
VNPGFALPEDQAILIARYMVARWQAHDVVWILPGDGDFRGEKAEKWKRIGRAVFGDTPARAGGCFTRVECIGSFANSRPSRGWTSTDIRAATATTTRH